LGITLIQRVDSRTSLQISRVDKAGDNQLKAWQNDCSTGYVPVIEQNRMLVCLYDE